MTDERRHPPVPAPASRPALERARRWLSLGRLRLASGLVIFAFALCHFVNHAVGILLVDSMEAARRWIMVVWHWPVGTILLYAALLLHPALSLASLYRRPSLLRLRPLDALQLVSGILIPLLIMGHVVGARLGESLFGMDSTYPRFLLHYWVEAPWLALRMAVLLVLVWGHGAIGVHYWLVRRAWYARNVQAAAVLFLLVPTLALAGIAASGVQLAQAVAADPSLATAIRAAARANQPAAGVVLGRIEMQLLAAWALIVVAVLFARAFRDWHRRSTSPVRVRYPGGREVVAPRGMSVLDASRFAGIPHQSICGGRGRCSTCRVQVLSADPALPAPSDAERHTLRRVGAGPDIRLACQVRPAGRVSVQPLVAVAPIGVSRGAIGDLSRGEERDVTVLFVDMRRSTELASRLLPYDALFVVNRYIDSVLDAASLQGGRLVSIAGDGVMVLFGLATDPPDAARAALATAADVWARTERLNEEIAAALPFPLRIGIGVHAAVSLVAENPSDGATVQMLGEAGNVASRLEGVAKARGATLVVSRQVVERVGEAVPPQPFERVAIAGIDAPLDLIVFRTPDEVAALLGETPAPSAPERPAEARPAAVG